MFSQGEGVSLLDHDLSFRKVGSEKLYHHGKGLGGGHDRRLRISLHKVGDVGGVVRLHVLDDQVVGTAGTQNLLNVVQPFMGKAGIHRVHHGCFLIQDHIGVVGHAVFDHVLAFEQVHVVVVDAHVADVFCNFH